MEYRLQPQFWWAGKQIADISAINIMFVIRKETFLNVIMSK